MGHRKRLLLVIILIAAQLFPSAAAFADEQKKKEKHQKLLKRYTAQSLSRLKYAIKNEGFFNAHVALNVWQSNAKDAGIFDEAQYDKFRRQIYEKSIKNNLAWFEIFLAQQNYRDARICLQLWVMHSKEIDEFDEERYEELKGKLNQ